MASAQASVQVDEAPKYNRLSAISIFAAAASVAWIATVLPLLDFTIVSLANLGRTEKTNTFLGWGYTPGNYLSAQRTWFMTILHLLAFYGITYGIIYGVDKNIHAIKDKPSAQQ